MKHTRERNNTQNRNALNQNTTFMSLPFIDDDLSRKINAKVRASGLPIKIVWQKGQTVSSILVRSALTPPNCPSGNKTCYACKFRGTGQVHHPKRSVRNKMHHLQRFRLRRRNKTTDTSTVQQTSPGCKKQNEGHSVRRPHAGPPLRHHDHKHFIEH